MKLEQLKPSSRIWIYQSDRFLTEQEIEKIDTEGKVFIENWTAHGSSLEAALIVKYSCFVIVAVDEQVANATGCSIDKSVHFISELEERLGVDFFNRMNLVVEIEGELEFVHFSELESKLNSGQIQPFSMTFDNTISNLGSLANDWKVPLAQSWAGKHLALT